MEKENIEEIIAAFPDYNYGENPYVGSKDYWRNIFKGESNRNPELHRAFSDFHKHLVQEVVDFCNKYNLTNIGDFSLYINDVQDSLEEGHWCSGTDSSMSLMKYGENEFGTEFVERDYPFLMSF